LQAIERVKVVNEKPAQLIEIAKVSELTDAWTRIEQGETKNKRIQFLKFTI
jgi:hypothetical protein